MSDPNNGSPDEKILNFSEGKGYVSMNVEPFKIVQDSNEQNEEGDGASKFF